MVAERRARGSTAGFLLTASLIVGATLSVGAVTEPRGAPTEVPAAPAFSLPDVNGKVTSLSEFATRPVLLVFYRGFW